MKRKQKEERATFKNPSSRWSGFSAEGVYWFKSIFWHLCSDCKMDFKKELGLVEREGARIWYYYSECTGKRVQQ